MLLVFFALPTLYYMGFGLP